MSEPSLPGYWVDRAATAKTYPPPTESWLIDAMAVAEALFETADGPPPRQRLYWLAENLRDYVASMGSRSAFVLRASLKTLTLLAPAVVLSPRPFVRLSLGARAQALSWLEHSPASLPLFAVKAAMSILWYEHPDNAKAVGLVPTARTRHR